MMRAHRKNPKQKEPPETMTPSLTGRGVSPRYVAITALMLCLASPASQATTPTRAAKVEAAAGHTRVVLEFPRSIKYKAFSLTNPARFVVDLEEVPLQGELEKLSHKLAASDPRIEKIRVGRFSPRITRVVLDLKTGAQADAKVLPAQGKYGFRLVLDVRLAPISEATSAEHPVTAPAKPAISTSAPSALQPNADEPPRFDIARFQVEGNTLLPTATVDRVLAPYSGKNRDFGDVQKALEALQQSYQKAGYSTVQVVLPEQELTQGMVRLTVIEARIREVQVEGNQFFDRANIRNALPSLKEGQAPQTSAVAADLRLANENPAKQTTVQLRSTGKEGEIDALVKVTDDKPWKIGATLDNTGTTATGRYRLGIGFQHANVANRDQVLNLQYLTSPDNPSDVSVYGLGYHLPLYSLKDSLDVFAGYSNVNSGVVQNLFTVSGKGTIFGLRYNHNLPKLDNYEQKLVYGLDYRAYENAAVPVGGGTSIVPDITIHPASLTYAGQWENPGIQTSFFLTLARNLPGGNRGGQTDFTQSRADAEANYTLYRYGATLNKVMPKDWQMRLALNGQYTTDALVSGEQFGLGGANSVRGFIEREIADDTGYQGNVELYTPDFGGKMGIDGVQGRMVVFYDFGSVHRNLPQPGETRSTSLASVGAGLRFSYKKNLSLRLDLASVIDPAGTQKRGDNMIHFNMGLIY